MRIESCVLRCVCSLHSLNTHAKNEYKNTPPQYFLQKSFVIKNIKFSFTPSFFDIKRALQSSVSFLNGN